MPKSKRNQKISLTKVTKNTKQQKQTLVQNLKSSIDKYAHLYIFRLKNQRNALLKNLKTSLKDDRFYFGKNKVMQLALGKRDSDEYLPGLCNVSGLLEGNVGLFFTNKTPEECRPVFEEYRKEDYARAGIIATETFKLEQGPVVRGFDNEKFPHNMETQLRALGMPTKLVNGVVTLTQDYTVCQKGAKLTSEQANLLKHFYIQMSEFSVKIVCHWKKEDGKFDVYDDQVDAGGEVVEEDAEMDD